MQRAIELTISRMADNATGPVAEKNKEEEIPYILSDRIFVRHKEKMVKIMITDILYIEADRNFSRIFTGSKEYLLSITLKLIEQKLPESLFLRIHRSYLINISQVEEVLENHVLIAQKVIPLGAGLKEKLLQRIHTF